MIKLVVHKKKFSACVRAARRMSSSSDRIVNPTNSLQKQAHISDLREYDQLYEKSLSFPYSFWEPFVKEFHWKKPPKEENFLSYNFDIRNGPIFIKWLEGAQLNVSYNLLDRHVRNGNGDKVAYYW